MNKTNKTNKKGCWILFIVLIWHILSTALFGGYIESADGKLVFEYMECADYIVSTLPELIDKVFYIIVSSAMTSL